MPVSIQVKAPGFTESSKSVKRIDRLVAGLKHAASPSFVRELPLDNFSTWLENRLAKESPGGGMGRNAWVRWLREGNESESPWADIQRPKFKKGWSVTRVDSARTTTFVTDHELLSLGTKGRARYRSIMEGSKTTHWTARYPFMFKRRGKVWVKIPKGKEMVHVEQEGTPVAQNVQRYIERFLLPRIGKHVSQILENQIA